MSGHGQGEDCCYLKFIFQCIRVYYSNRTKKVMSHRAFQITLVGIPGKQFIAK